MNLYDFYTGSYGLFTGLFAAIFGMSFPLILQCIQRIDEKYGSSVISQNFERETPNKLFQWLLFPYIIMVCASPLVLGRICTNAGLSYAFQCFMFLYILLIAVVMVILFKRITVYYSIDRLLKSINVSKPERDILICFDLAKYATEKGYQEAYIEAMSKVAECFIIERNEHAKNTQVEHSEGLKRVLLEIGRMLKSRGSELDYRFSDIMSIILDYSDEHYISDSTYRLIWFMLNNAATTGNTQWIRDYWTWAVQYYEFKSNHIQEGRHNPEMRKFLLYNVMFGAVLTFNQRNECLAHIFKYSNVTNRYPLIPGNFRDIMVIARRIESILEKPMEMEARFQIAGLSIGVNTDQAIFAEAIRYLALVFIRMWSYQDYNIGYCNPLTIPSPSNVSIDENEANIRLAGLIRKYVISSYDSGDIENLGLSIIPEKEVVTKLIDEFNEKCQSKNKEIFGREGYDTDKLKHIYDEAVISNASSQILLPSKSLIGDRDYTTTFETLVCVSHPVERRFLHPGQSAECGGIGNGLSMDLNLKIRQEFIDKVKGIFDLKEESIARESLNDRLNELLQNGPKAIFDLSGGIDEVDGLDGATVYNIGRIWIKDALLVCDVANTPTLDIIEGVSGSAMVETLDSHNYLYGSIYELADHYDVSIMQSISIGYVKGKPVGWLIFIN